MQVLNIQGEELNTVIDFLYRSVLSKGEAASPRGKRVLEWSGPCSIGLSEHRSPWTLIPGRRLNPYFAIAEVIWILAGREDVDFIAYYNKNISQFSDDGVRFHGAYGARMRNHPTAYIPESGLMEVDAIDQIALVIERLKRDGESRQAVISLWNPDLDLREGFKDYPCNNLCYFTLRDAVLNMSVVRRSNDMIWGLPYNQIQFYFLQALIAGSLSAQMGGYAEFIQNIHVYLDNYPHIFDLVRQRIEAEGIFTAPLDPSPPDRRITLKQLETFCEIFFQVESRWRSGREKITLARVLEAQMLLISANIPKYWATDMLFIPAAYIARWWGEMEIHDRLVQEVEPSLQWLVKDFNQKKE